MEIIRPAIAHRDHRGYIIDILEATDFNYATIITSRRGVTRGNHYHKLTTQWVFVIKGKMMAHSRMPGSEIQRAVIKAGDVIKNVPLEHHALTALENSEFLVLTSGLRGGKDYEKDTYRLQEPMQAE